MKSLCTKVPDDFKDEVEQVAQESGRTTSDLIRMCVEDLVYGHYRVEGEHIVPTDEYMFALRKMDNPPDDDDAFEYDRLKFSQILKAYRANNYPDDEIIRQNESIAEQIRENGAYSPRRYRDEAC